MLQTQVLYTNSLFSSFHLVMNTQQYMYFHAMINECYHPIYKTKPKLYNPIIQDENQAPNRNIYPSRKPNQAIANLEHPHG